MERCLSVSVPLWEYRQAEARDPWELISLSARRFSTFIHLHPNHQTRNIGQRIKTRTSRWYAGFQLQLHVLSNPFLLTVQRLIRNIHPPPPTPARRRLRRLQPPTHLPNRNNILHKPHRRSHRVLHRIQQRRAKHPLLPTHRRHLPRAAVPAREPGGRGRRGAGPACCVWDREGDGCEEGGCVAGFGARRVDEGD